jgi:hypothetical protein
MSRPHREFSDDHTPLAYLITFRSYGTWLHGDPRGSVDRFHNVYGTPRLPPNSQREKYERRLPGRIVAAEDISGLKSNCWMQLLMFYTTKVNLCREISVKIEWQHRSLPLSVL